VTDTTTSNELPYSAGVKELASYLAHKLRLSREQEMEIVRALHERTAQHPVSLVGRIVTGDFDEGFVTRRIWSNL
jgi:hypothetical protein